MYNIYILNFWTNPYWILQLLQMEHRAEWRTAGFIPLNNGSICRIFPCFSERDRKRSSSPGQKELDHSTMKLISAELLWPSVSGRKVPSQICPQGQALGPARLVNKKLDMSEKPKKKWWKRWSPWSPFLVFRNRKKQKAQPSKIWANHNKITPFNWYRLNHPKNALKLLSNNTQYIVTPQMYQQKKQKRKPAQSPSGAGWIGSFMTLLCLWKRNLKKTHKLKAIMMLCRTRAETSRHKSSPQHQMFKLFFCICKKRFHLRGLSRTSAAALSSFQNYLANKPNCQNPCKTSHVLLLMSPLTSQKFTTTHQDTAADVSCSITKQKNKKHVNATFFI